MKILDVQIVKLPLTKKSFRKLRSSLHSKQIKWMDMSKDLMYAYQDFWKSEKFQSMDDMVQD